MDSQSKVIAIVIISFFIFAGLMLTLSGNKKSECIAKGMEAKYSASEIEQMCKF